MSRKNDKDRCLGRLTAKLSEDKVFWSYLLACYLRATGLDSQYLTDRFKCGEQNLQRLSLCKLPRTDPGTRFLDDVEMTADFSDIEPDKILGFYRECIAIESLGASAEQQSSQGYLKAARSRKRTDGETGTNEDKAQ